MPPSAPAATESLVPVLRYRDVETAALWLSNAFGFELKTLVKADSIPASQNEHGSEETPAPGAIYAELAHGRGTIMLVPVGQSDLDAHMRQPDELGGVETQTCYVTVGDPSAHLDRAVQGGAEIVLPLSGGAGEQFGYSCRDIEGHLWNFGTYAPASTALDIQAPPAAARNKKTGQNGLRWTAPALTLSLMGLAGWAWFMPGNPLTSVIGGSVLEAAGLRSAQTAEGAQTEGARDAAAQEVSRRSQETILKLRQEVAEARTAMKAAQEAANSAAKDLAAEHARRTQAVQGGEGAAARVIKLEADLAASKENLARLEMELLKERSARGQSVQAAETARSALEQEIKRREQLEHVVQELDAKADERLQAKTKKPETAASPVEETPSPAVTGSIAAPDAPAPPSASTDSAGQAPQKTEDTPDRSKTAGVKRQRQTYSAGTASKSAPKKNLEEKPWPYSAW